MIQSATFSFTMEDNVPGDIVAWAVIRDATQAPDTLAGNIYVGGYSVVGTFWR